MGIQFSLQRLRGEHTHTHLQPNSGPFRLQVLWQTAFAQVQLRRFVSFPLHVHLHGFGLKQRLFFPAIAEAVRCKRPLRQLLKRVARSLVRQCRSALDAAALTTARRMVSAFTRSRPSVHTLCSAGLSALCVSCKAKAPRSERNCVKSFADSMQRPRRCTAASSCLLRASR